jgi:hypothetical protein
LETKHPQSNPNLPQYRSAFAGRQAPAYGIAGVIATGFVLSMAMGLPGQLSYDSVIQLLEGRTAAYSGWHPPVMSWLLGLGDVVQPGAALYVLATATVLFGVIASLPWLVRKPSWWGIVVALVCILSPQLAMYQSTVWKDVLFADATVVTFVLLAHAARRWDRVPLRMGLLAGACVFAVLAVLARQNGAAVLLGFIAAVMLVARRNGAGLSRSLLSGMAALVLTGGMALLARAALSTRIADHEGAARQVRLLQFFDLVGALAGDPHLRFPELQRTQPKLLAVMRTDAVQLYSAARSDTLVRSAPLQKALAATPVDALRGAWMWLIFSDTGTYLHERMKVFSWVLVTPDLSACVPYVVGLRGPPEVLRKLGMKTRVTARDRMINGYGKLLAKTPIFSHLSFLLLALAEFGFLAVRRRGTDLVLACLLLAATLFAASFFFVSIACDYRYLYLLDLAALTTAIYVTADSSLDCKERDRNSSVE